jgi:hypothetical protein
VSKFAFGFMSYPESLLLGFVEDRYHAGINAEAINNEVDSSFSICTVLVMVSWGKYTAGGCISRSSSSQPIVSALLSGNVWNVLSDNFWTTRVHRGLGQSEH